MAQEMALDRGITLNSDKIGLPSLHEDCPRSRDYETVALFRTSEQQKRARSRDCCTFRTSEQQKRARSRDCCTFSYFRTAKASGNTRLLHFFVLPNSKSEREHETVALFRTSEQQKCSGLRDCCTFSYFRTAKASGITKLLHFFVLPNSKNERDYETVALFRTSEQHKRAGPKALYPARPGK